VEISTGLSLTVIIGVLAVTVIASLRSDKGKAQNAVTAARHHAIEYLDVETDPARREEIFAKLATEIEVIKSLPEKYRARIRQEEKLMALFTAAREEHERVTADAGGGRAAATAPRRAR
jgi:tellurite resistance protein TerC